MSWKPSYGDLRLAEDVAWVVEATCTLVVKEKSREVLRLTGFEQALWDCLDLGFSFEQTRKILGALGKMSPEATEREIVATLRGWQSGGFVESKKNG